MNFDDILNEDLGDAFLNLDEFGREIAVDGTTIVGILDEGDTRETIQGLPSYGPDYGERMWAEKKTLYVKESDIQPVPRSTQELQVDGEMYQVSEVTNENGLIILLLSAIGS